MPPIAVTSLHIRPYLERCGYTGDRLAEDYRFANASVSLAGFFGKPWDARSACIAVVDATVDSYSAAQNCLNLGAPTAFVCRGDSLDWWKLSFPTPTEQRTVRATEIEGFFREHRDELAPDAIYGAKLRRPTRTAEQMWFVDVGLMPALERCAGEALNRLVTQAIRSLMDDLGSKVRSLGDERGVYKTVFWLLAAKLLKEKRVQGFKALDPNDVRRVFTIVGKHYRDAQDFPPGDKTWLPAISRVAAAMAGWGNLGNISTESLAYLYETALIGEPRRCRNRNTNKPREDVRKTLGIHSTPSILVDHMLSQLWPLVDPNKLVDQRVFEPACGHGAFLTAAMRDLRNWSGMDDSAARHRYLRERIRGIEFDPFAVEIAKLSLTLADVPYGNMWQIAPGDMFTPGALRKAARWATVVLSNPPYESFKKSKANRFERTDEPVTAQTKAVEMLKRVVPNLADGAVFGFVLPQGTLYDTEAKTLRQELLKSCEIAEISLFEDKLFNEADQETCILLGRRKRPNAALSSVRYRRVRNRDMEAFKSSLAFSREDVIDPSELGRGEDTSLLEPDLRDLWSLADRYPRLRATVDVQQGFQLKAEKALGTRVVVSATPRVHFTKAVLSASDRYAVWQLPKVDWVDLRPANIRRPGAATTLGKPQVIVNYSGPREAWRFRPVVDPEGVAVSSRFLAMRAKRNARHSLYTLWAVLLSPVANAYAFSWSGKRQTLVREWEAMPLPDPTPRQKAEIEAAAAAYVKAAMPPRQFTLAQPDESAIRRALLEVDAAVLRLYDLPPRLERRLLDIFEGVERPGVGCSFRGYPPGWSCRSKPPLTLPVDDRPIWERIASLAEALPDEVIKDLPTDGASQLDHYLYGAPKRTP